jgi:4-hydroxy-2-oxoheptanedioate aldolase
MRNLKQALRAGEPLVGTWINAPNESEVEIAGWAGFDFVVLDTEHSAYDLETAGRLARAADAAGVPSLIRVAETPEVNVGKALDFGVQGIMIPHVSTAAQAAHVIRCARYAPEGERGAAPSVRGARYGLVPWVEYRERTAKDGTLVLQIEGREGIANLDAILATAGLDVVFIGTFDLSNALGVPGQLDHPRLLEAVGDIVRRARARGVSVGMWMPEPEQIAPWIARGVQFLTVTNSDRIFMAGCRAVVGEVRAQIEKSGT